MFYANNRLVFSSVDVQTECKGNEFYIFDKIENWDPILELLFSTERQKSIWIRTSDEKSAFSEFSKLFTSIEAAGGLIFNEFNELLVIKRRGYYDFPKGKLDEGETPEDAAIREVIEECGVSNVQIVQFLSHTYHLYQLPNSRVLKTTHWFIMKTHKQPLMPQTSEDITEAFWLPFSEIDQIKQQTYPSLLFLLEVLQKKTRE